MAAASLPSRDDDNDDNDRLTCMGFMFGSSQAYTLKRFEWNDSQTTVSVMLSVVDDDPGALQSGHYLWPAAPALVKYLIKNKQNMSKPTCIVELGAGCALASLAALQIFSVSLQCLVVTDHDPGTLKRAQDSYEATMLELKEKKRIESVEKVASVPFLLEPLSWGNDSDAVRVLSFLSSSVTTTGASATISTGCDLVLGSELIYSVEVVKPLFTTVSSLLQRSGSSMFVLSQSFSLDAQTEQAIDQTCETLGLQRNILLDTLTDPREEGVCIQKFRWI